MSRCTEHGASEPRASDARATTVRRLAPRHGEDECCRFRPLRCNLGLSSEMVISVRVTSICRTRAAISSGADHIENNGLDLYRGHAGDGPGGLPLPLNHRRRDIVAVPSSTTAAVARAHAIAAVKFTC
jgi:hypothetical protein